MMNKNLAKAWNALWRKFDALKVEYGELVGEIEERKLSEAEIVMKAAELGAKSDELDRIHRVLISVMEDIDIPDRIRNDIYCGLQIEEE